MTRVRTFLLPWAILLLARGITCPLAAQRPEAVLVRACELQINSHGLVPWHIAPIAKDAAAAAKLSHTDPVRVFGDFDGDGRKDVALLIQRGIASVLENPQRLASFVIVVCLNPADELNFFQIVKPYCGDGIALSPKGNAYHDFETEQNGSYQFDGVSAYCLERAGRRMI